MDKIARPRGLVRYDSFNGLEGKKRRIIRPRIFVYSVILVLGGVALSFALTKVHDVDMQVTRMRGMPYFVSDEAVRNQFQVQVMTKRNEETMFKLGITDAPEWLQVSGTDESIIAPAQGSETVTLVVFAPRSHYTGSFTMTILSRSEPGGTVIERKVEFVGPDPRLFEEDENQTPTE